MKKKTQFLQVKTSFIILLIVNIGLCTSCNNDCRDVPSISDIDINIEYTALEKKIKNVEAVENLATLLIKYRTMSDYFLHAQNYPTDTVLARRLFKLIKNPYMDTLFLESTEKFSNMSKFIDEFKDGYKRLKYYYPDIKIPKLQTIVTGFYNDLYISDSLIIIGLDYFIGKNGTYRPYGIPSYILNRYEKENLLPILFTFISKDFNNSDLKNNTLLADMINLGKSYYFVSQLLPCTRDDLIIGFMPDEMKLVKENQEVIWANLIENEMLYKTEDFLKKKFIGERPNIPEINKKCPGRVGVWLGWEIVKAYMKANPYVSITELMANNDAHLLFQQAKYRPKNVK